MAREDFRGTIGRTVEESTPWWREPAPPPEGAPDLVLVVLGDVGFAHPRRLRSEEELPVGEIDARLDFVLVGDERARVTLSVQGREVSAGEIPRVVPLTFGEEPLEVGARRLHARERFLPLAVPVRRRHPAGDLRGRSRVLGGRSRAARALSRRVPAGSSEGSVRVAPSVTGAPSPAASARPYPR